MPADPTGDPLPQASYRGFSGPAEPPRPRGRPWGRILAIGACAAIVLGVGFGFLVRPDLKESEAPAGGPAVPIVVGRAAPQPAATASDGKIEVLPPDVAAEAKAQASQAQASQAQPPPDALLPQVDTPSASDQGSDAATPAPSVQPAPLPIAPPPPAQRFARGGAPAPACAGAPGPAEQLICQDPDLAAADRAMNRAYRRALAAGADPQQLRAEQRDFMSIREDAAARSPRALASVMAQRTDDLNAMAADARRDDDGGDDEGPGY